MQEKIVTVNEVVNNTGMALQQIEKHSPKLASTGSLLFYHYVIMRIEQENFKLVRDLALQQGGKEKVKDFLENAELVVQDYLSQSVVILEDKAGEKNGGDGNFRKPNDSN